MANAFFLWIHSSRVWLSVTLLLTEEEENAEMTF